MTFIESLRRTVRLGSRPRPSDDVVVPAEDTATGDVTTTSLAQDVAEAAPVDIAPDDPLLAVLQSCLLYTSDAADDL